MNPTLLLVCVGLPLAVAVGLAGQRTRRYVRGLAPWMALPVIPAAILAPGDFDLGWMLLGGHLGLDWIAAVFLPVTAGLWLAAGLFANAYLEPGRDRDRFFGYFLTAMTGNLLLLVALDAVVFYLGFALMSFASYGLVVLSGTERARHAGRYYIALVVIGEICVVSALMMLASRAPIDFVALRETFLADVDGRNNLILALLLVGFGIKAGVFGLHFWLPLAHPVAPAPASAVLSGAMIKAGLVAWMRLLPLGEMALPAWGGGLALLGLFTAYYGVVAGLPQREPKTVLAYSSVSQMGVMTLAIGLGLAFPGQWPLLAATLLIYMVHHALVKGGLFLGAGLVQHALSPAAARLAAMVLVIGALSLAGGPLTGGLVAKLALKQTAELVASPWSEWLPLALSLSSLFTALLMTRFLWLAWPRSSAQARPLPPALLAPWLALLVAWLAGPWLLARPLLRGEAASLAAAWAAFWPMAVAALLAWAAVQLRRRGRLPAWPALPAGDLGILVERGVLRFGTVLGRGCTEGLPRLRSMLASIGGALVRSGPGWSLRLAGGEMRITAWPVTAVLLLLIAATVAWLFA